MALDFNDLIRAFEPILYFAPGERFFPSDCKRYLERCALWNAVDPFDDQNSWHKNTPGSAPGPVITRLQISARPDEQGTFLGDPQGGSFPFLYASGPDDGFLDLAGWTDGQSVFANLDQIEKLYDPAATPSADPVLPGSRFWYHAEVFDFPRLRVLLESPDAPPDFKAILQGMIADHPLDGDPLLLCYYLFFPGHDEPLDNCEDVAESAMFGSHAGEWACMAIFMKHQVIDIPIGGGPPGPETCTPIAIGLTSRNAGDIGFLGGERRVGMRVVDFSTMTTVTRDRPSKLKGIHPRLFVAKGTHGLYPAPAFIGQPIPSFAPDDSASQHCGAAELLGKSLEDLDEEAKDAADDTWVDDSEVVWTKFGLLGPLWAGLEWVAGGGGGVDAPGSRTPDQFDHPPQRDAPGYFGAIVHPAGVDPLHGEETALKFAWQFPLANEAELQTQSNGRAYSLRVDRISQDPLKRQVWWPGMQGNTGYSGRWGARVARDPKARRAGMKFPEFWEMFVAAFGKSKSQ